MGDVCGAEKARLIHQVDVVPDLLLGIALNLELTRRTAMFVFFEIEEDLPHKVHVSLHARLFLSLLLPSTIAISSSVRS